MNEDESAIIIGVKDPHKLSENQKHQIKRVAARYLLPLSTDFIYDVLRDLKEKDIIIKIRR